MEGRLEFISPPFCLRSNTAKVSQSEVVVMLPLLNPDNIRYTVVIT
jgi:hypothetical protein